MKKRLFVLIPVVLALFSCNNPQQQDDPGQRQEDNPGEKKDDRKEDNRRIDDADDHKKDSGIDSSVNSSNELEVKVQTSFDDVEVTDSTISKITDLEVEGISYDSANKIFTITKGGEFTFKGSFNGNIVVNAGDDDEVKLTLNNFTIKSKTDSPIKCNNASECQISIKKDSTNYIYDLREHESVDDDTQGNGAITSSCDMKVSGKGSLFIVAKYKNGIHCKDDLTIKNEVNNDSSLQIYAYNNCLKGNDSVEIQNGNHVLISTDGNGIMTEATDVSSKGNQRGNVDILGGHIDIYCAKDAIDAAYNANIEKSDDVDAPILNIYTSSYSKYSNEVAAVSTEKFYLRLPNSTDIANYYYGIEFLNSDYTTTWVKASKDTNNDNRYKYLVAEKPSTATSFKICSFANSTTEMSEENAYAKMDSYESINDYYDVATFKISGSSIVHSGWTNYQTNQGRGPGGMQEQTSDKSDVSAKGIKADNEVNISDGTFFIKTYDDGIHANNGDVFENGETGLGNVNISGGEFTIYASDDGIHADLNLNITGGTIDVKYSYEGIEANILNISGGYTKVYSTDDGLNAANKSGVTPQINISGGITDVTVYGQDVDGIDSNGKFSQTGGYVISKGGNSQMATGLDVDGTAIVSGGTFVAFGSTEKTITKKGDVTAYGFSGSFSSGDYNIVFGDGTSVVVTTKYSYSKIYVYSDNSKQISVEKK